MMVKDKEALRGKLGHFASIPDLKRIIVSHGAMISASAPETFRAVAAEL